MPEREPQEVSKPLREAEDIYIRTTELYKFGHKVRRYSLMDIFRLGEILRQKSAVKKQMQEFKRRNKDE